jgi:hypothetical protein
MSAEEQEASDIAREVAFSGLAAKFKRVPGENRGSLRA